MLRPVVLSANSSWNIANFRAPLIRDLVARKRRVVVLSPPDRHVAKIIELGAEHRSLPMDSAGLSPIADARLLWRYRAMLRELRPSAFLGFTIKPNIYGSMAASSLGVPVINNISGLGTAFLKPGPLQRLVSGLYRIALRRSSTVFFQNEDDRSLFLERGLVSRESVRLLPGSGVDLERFRPPSGKREPGPFRFLLVARMLRDKGVVEYVEAARGLRQDGAHAEFALLGPAASDNRSAIGRDELAAWQEAGLVTWLGEADDVRPHLSRADCVVLPSYREGLPRSLIEAAAMGRPIIASDVPGCRAAVDDSVSGLLCAPRSAEALADAMSRMLGLSEEGRQAMGAAGRAKAEREFGEERIVAAYRDALDRSGTDTR